MDELSTLLSFADRMLWTTALVAAPVLLASLAVGLVIGLVQAATSVNEQTLTFVPKLAAIASFAGSMFETAVRIALPVTLVLLLVQILTGVLSRSAPALNLFALGLPAGVLAGIAALIAAAPLMADQMTDLSATAIAETRSLVLR